MRVRGFQGYGKGENLELLFLEYSDLWFLFKPLLVNEIYPTWQLIEHKYWRIY